MPLLLSIVSDLYFSVQIGGAAKALGWDWQNVDSPDQIPAQPPLVQHAGVPTSAQNSPAGHGFVTYVVETQPSLIVLELQDPQGAAAGLGRALPWETWVVAAKTSPATRRIPILAFGPHVDVGLRDRALKAGCDVVVSKGRFTSAMPDLLREHARLPDGSAAQAAAEGELSERARKGIELFNRGEYFEAHEELEHAWNEDNSPGRDLYRGILQIAVAYLQVTRRNYNGAIKMFLRARQWLDPLPDVCKGVDVAALRRDAAEVRAALEDLGADRIREFELATLQPLKWAAR